ncbi:Chloroplastic lipocalin-like protein [Drosera capensis]
MQIVSSSLYQTRSVSASSCAFPYPSPRTARKKRATVPLICSLQEDKTPNKSLLKHILAGFTASCVFLSPVDLVYAAESYEWNNLFQLAYAPATQLDMLEDGLKLHPSNADFLVRDRRTAIAQGMYTIDEKTPAIQVDTFCVHGGPDGYITGIRGRVQCLPEEDKEKTENNLQREVMITEKCFLRFPTLPLIPKQPYDVLATDYDNFTRLKSQRPKFYSGIGNEYHLASEFAGCSIYSRTPNPGPKFILKYKNRLAEFGYDPNQIKDTPQDCEVISNAQLTAMMSAPGMQRTLIN